MISENYDAMIVHSVEHARLAYEYMPSSYAYAAWKAIERVCKNKKAPAPEAQGVEQE